jgi:hypothetical protein
MGTDYPAHLLAREPAPPYAGEGPFALWHFSEDPSLGRLRPHTPATNPQERPMVWAVYAYRVPERAFRPHEVGGYWVADQQVEATEQVVIDDLPGKHAGAGIELRITPSVWPFWRRVTSSTVEFSGSRLRNSAPHPARFE